MVNTIWWGLTGGIVMFGACWAMIPIYELYCQASGQGIAKTSHKEYAPPPEKPEGQVERLVEVDFQGTLGGALPWTFKPEQKRIVVTPGETALAFFTAKNHSDKPVIGVSVYHMIPPEAGLYFNKIQCFCFEEQLLNPHEEVDMPVFFFIDPLFSEDPIFRNVHNITLSYIFYESASETPEGYENINFQKAAPTKEMPLVRPAPNNTDV